MKPVDAVGLTPYGFDEAVQALWNAHEGEGDVLGRVAAEHRGAYSVYTASGAWDAVLTGRLVHELEQGLGSRPAVGDWVVLTGRPEEGTAVIHGMLPRRSVLRRKAAGRAVQEQVVAANMDWVLLLMGCEHDLNPRRLERYLVAAWDSGARPVVVLTKADLAEDVEALLAEVRRVSGDAPVHAISSHTGQGVEELEAYLAGNRTVALTGSSGVGKSTLVNRWLPEDARATQELREDGRGKHTTTHRELVVRPTGGLVIDTPGMRELGLLEAEEGLSQTFADVTALIAACRFRDCGHEREAGCAVRQALVMGELEQARWNSYLKLQREQAHLERQRQQQQQKQTQRRAPKQEKPGRRRRSWDEGEDEA
ncbi:MAG TPA: ribosome small subunit-dependent GTPase A [Archangium sp.]|uniref:ribosome small subunit-dependent GTPase A n=1 Tax=Archangium sp. TaxID=1872627 RepID=UPI002E36601D|nr:ribosome small subunit-dependent GTPase A [Archangium sp.]HEX5751356.1 ribosome small subunit-dependent GTPase A [Archangium sp.]